MKLLIRRLNELSSKALYKIIKLRIDVFVVEQACPYEECDNKDLESVHIYLEDKEDLVAYLRVLPPGVSYEESSIGRVLVNKRYRDEGFGRQIMTEGINYCKNNFQGDIKISGQAYLENFYMSLGFKTVSDVYLEDNIPHIDMVYYNKGKNMEARK